MRKKVIGIYHNGDFIEGIPYVYNGTSWVYAVPMVYSSGWENIGGTGNLFFHFREKNSTDDFLVDNGSGSSNVVFLVRDR